MYTVPVTFSEVIICCNNNTSFGMQFPDFKVECDAPPVSCTEISSIIYGLEISSITIGIVVTDAWFIIEEMVDFGPLKLICFAPQQLRAILAEELLPIYII